MGLNRVVRRIASAVVWSDAAERDDILEQIDADAAGYDDVDEFRAAKEAESADAEAKARAEAQRVEAERSDEVARLRAENERLRAAAAEQTQAPAAPAPTFTGGE